MGFGLPVGRRLSAIRFPVSGFRLVLVQIKRLEIRRIVVGLPEQELPVHRGEIGLKLVPHLLGEKLGPRTALGELDVAAAELLLRDISLRAQALLVLFDRGDLPFELDEFAADLLHRLLRDHERAGNLPGPRQLGG